MERAKRIFIYLRKSRRDIVAEKKAGREGDTLARHRKTLINFANKHGYVIVEIYEEVVSGESIAEREEIQKMLERVENEEVYGVLVMDTDRLGRGDMQDAGIIERAFRDSETMVITPDEILDPTSETWELMWSVKSLVSRQELKIITKRMQGGRRTSVLEGKSISKKPPYGYRRDEFLLLTPDESTAWVVRKIFDMVCEGKGRRTIARELDELGVKPPFSKTWSPSSVVQIVQNEAYIGCIVWGKFKYTKRNGKYQRKKVPREKWNIVEEAHEPLVSREIFEQANEAYSNRHHTSEVRKKKLRNPLAGVVRCGVCKKSMTMIPRKKRPDHTFTCASNECQGVQRSIGISNVEKALLGGIAEVVETLEYEARAPKRVDASIVSPLKKQRSEKEAELETLTTQKGNLHALLEQGIYTPEVFIERQGVIVAEMEKLQAEIKAIDEEIVKASGIPEIDTEKLAKIRTALEGYDQADVEAKNKFLKSVIESAYYIRKPEWTDANHFELNIKTKI